MEEYPDTPDTWSTTLNYANPGKLGRDDTYESLGEGRRARMLSASNQEDGWTYDDGDDPDDPVAAVTLERDHADNCEFILGGEATRCGCGPGRRKDQPTVNPHMKAFWDIEWCGQDEYEYLNYAAKKHKLQRVAHEVLTVLSFLVDADGYVSAGRAVLVEGVFRLRSGARDDGDIHPEDFPTEDQVRYALKKLTSVGLISPVVIGGGQGNESIYKVSDGVFVHPEE